jgi:hypothetical protein
VSLALKYYSLPLIFSDEASDGCSRQVPYDDIEANPADYYDVSKYKDFVKNPLQPDVDVMELASMAVTLRNSDFTFYDHDLIQANILSHTHIKRDSGTGRDDGGDGSEGKGDSEQESQSEGQDQGKDEDKNTEGTGDGDGDNEGMGEAEGVSKGMDVSQREGEAEGDDEGDSDGAGEAEGVGAGKGNGEDVGKGIDVNQDDSQAEDDDQGHSEGEGDAMKEGQWGENEDKNGDGDKEAEAEAEAEDGKGPGGEPDMGIIRQKGQAGERMSMPGSHGPAISGSITTRGRKRKAELEAIRTTRSKAPRLDVRLKRAFRHKQKGRHY